MTHQQYQSCIEACVACAQECEHCGDACLSEQDVAKMAECIRLDRDCAEICWAAAAYMSRGSRFMQDMYCLRRDLRRLRSGVPEAPSRSLSALCRRL